MARLRLLVDVPDWSVNDLCKAIVDLDTVDSGARNAIAIENVQASDVLEAMMNGSLGVQYEIVEQGMEN